jgi:cytoskeletal protein RodZ
MAAISETLRQARLRSGVDLDRLAAKTKINPRYLEAIEKGDFDKLPSGIFARMFIKQYADAVGLDGATFADEFQRSTQFGNYSPPTAQAIVEARGSFQPSIQGINSSSDRGRNEQLTSMLGSLIWVVAAILVCAGAYYGLAHLPSRTAETAGPSPSTPKPLAAVPSPGPAQSNPATASNATPTATSPNTGAATPPATQGTAPSVTTPPADGAAPIRLAFNAIDPVWVTATADGKTVVSELLQPGTSKTVAAEKGARVTLGNAGGVEITFNGKKLEPFGPKGQVRTVDFTPWGAQVVSRTPPSSDPLL